APGGTSPFRQSDRVESDICPYVNHHVATSNSGHYLRPNVWFVDFGNLSELRCNTQRIRPVNNPFQTRFCGRLDRQIINRSKNAPEPIGALPEICVAKLYTEFFKQMHATVPVTSGRDGSLSAPP